MNTQQLILDPWQARSYEERYRIVKRSVDARQKNIKVLLTLLADIHGRPLPKDAPVPLYDAPQFRDVHNADKKAVIVGSGPAGLFAALTMLEYGIKPVIIERGKEVSERKRDIAKLCKNEGLNAESNYCFGEGGAGTFSDGKLFSRSKKRGNMQRVMELFHYFGTPDTVLYEAHAHIGSDCLPAVIRRMRECIISHGGEIHFSSVWQPSMLDLPTILAIGHSAHDTYRRLYDTGVMMEAKGCAMGVRVEHPQSLINSLMYHLDKQDTERNKELVCLLGNASYSLVTQVEGCGVYSFCMCPGGYMVPAGSDSGSCVVNERQPPQLAFCQFGYGGGATSSRNGVGCPVMAGEHRTQRLGGGAENSEQPAFGGSTGTATTGLCIWYVIILSARLLLSARHSAFEARPMVAA